MPETSDLLAGNTRALARAITLIESTLPEDIVESEKLLDALTPHSGKSVRIGISGSPGVGKSTFIDSFGMKLIEQGHRVAVLAVDPSSTITGGSILGDKTRMSKLLGNSNSYVRPSPSGGSLGGVHRKTREVILMCEAAGFDRILVETVGVGQSEIDAANMTDFYLLLMLPNAGDELQGIKKGILELADCIFVNKSDIDSQAAERAKTELASALTLSRPRTPNWEIPVLSGSAHTGLGLDQLIEVISIFCNALGYSLSGSPQIGSAFLNRRNSQLREWLRDAAQFRLNNQFMHSVKAILPGVEAELIAGKIRVHEAVEKLFDAYRKNGASN